jgi:hypothetical protein
MSRNEYTPNERIIDRVCMLWSAALENPRYDNGDTTGGSGFAAGMAAMLPRNSTEDVLARFRQELKAILMDKFTEPPFRAGGEPYVHWVTDLACDYGPCNALRTAAERAGLKTQFPWKTRMGFDEHSIHFGEGYAAPYIYHYPASADRWVVTSLRGEPSDIDALVKFAEEGGRAAFFRVDAASVPCEAC